MTAAGVVCVPHARRSSDPADDRRNDVGPLRCSLRETEIQ